MSHQPEGKPHIRPPLLISKVLPNQRNSEWWVWEVWQGLGSLRAHRSGTLKDCILSSSICHNLSLQSIAWASMCCEGDVRTKGASQGHEPDTLSTDDC